MPYLSYDPHLAKAEKAEYTVRSIYYDSPGLMTYQEKLAGIRERRKYRIRGYNSQTPDSIVFTEIKRKDGDHIWKDRATLLLSNVNDFLLIGSTELLYTMNGERQTVERYAKNFLYYVNAHRLRPVVLITYEREAFLCKFGTDLRITFDKNIRANICNSALELYCDDFKDVVLKEYFVLEVKFRETIPGWLPRVLQRYDIRRTSASKYVMGIESVYEKVQNRRFFYV